MNEKQHRNNEYAFIKQMFTDNNMFCETCRHATPIDDIKVDCDKLKIDMKYGDFCSHWEEKDEQ